MRTARVAVLFFVVLTAGCGGVKPTPPGEAQPTGAAPAGAATTAPVVRSVTPPSPTPPAVVTQAALAPIEPAERPTAPSTPAPAGKSAAKAEASAAKSLAKAPAPPAPAAQPQKAVAPESAKPKEPPLDLTSLETRLKDTKAIGVMTKIALKNQVDDLLNQFRAFYQGKLKTTLAELRRPFDLLILKVLSLLQDSDPSLAAAIAASRETIWGILSDPVKFANFASI